MEQCPRCKDYSFESMPDDLTGGYVMRCTNPNCGFIEDPFIPEDDLPLMDSR